MTKAEDKKQPQEQPETNAFEASRGRFNSLLLGGSYDSAGLNATLQDVFSTVSDGLKPTDKLGRATRYGMVALMCEQAIDLATRNGDQLSATAFRTHGDTFATMSSFLDPKAPSAKDPLPPQDKMKGVKR